MPTKLKSLEAKVFIDSPPANSTVGTSFQIKGSASAEAFVEIAPGEPDVEDATGNIIGVSVRVGATGAVQPATATGSAPKPWTTWLFAVDTALVGPQVITAFVGVTSGGLSAFATSDRNVVIDLTAPTLTINPPADVTNSTPPYTAVISGTLTDDAALPAVEWRLGDSGEFQTAKINTSW